MRKKAVLALSAHLYNIYTRRTDFHEGNRKASMRNLSSLAKNTESLSGGGRASPELLILFKITTTEIPRSPYRQ